MVLPLTMFHHAFFRCPGVPVPYFRHRLVRLLPLLQNCLKQTGRGWGSLLWLISDAFLFKHPP